MVDTGAARIVLGNHEFNAVAWATPDPDAGGWCRRHTDENLAQHRAFLDAVGADSARHAAWIEWFMTVPLWLDLGGLRVVHACWSFTDMSTLGPWLTTADALTHDAVILGSRRTHPVYTAVEVVLKCPEVPLGEGRSYQDKGGVPRHRARTTAY